MKKKPIKRIRKIRVLNADNRVAIKKLADNSIDSIVTDPPYALVSVVKRFGKRNAAPAKGNQAFVRASRGFMGQTWDTAEVTNDVTFWVECLRVLKPGGHMLAFGGTRTYHRMVCAIEDSGFEVRDMIQWLYGSGFPKSHDVSKGIDKAAGAKRKVIKRRTLNNNRFATSGAGQTQERFRKFKDNASITAPTTKNAKKYQGWGTALKPANEPIVLARKPLSEKTVAANVLKWGTGAINVDGCRVATAENPSAKRRAGKSPEREAGTWSNDRRSAKTFAAVRSSESLGRFPANVITDGSDEVVAMFPTTSGSRATVGVILHGRSGGIMGKEGALRDGRPEGHNDAGGSTARFFYQAKANKTDRAGSKHPTVKPIDLIRYLIRLVTPPNGIVLDPFAGSGTTAEAAIAENRKVILIEREKKYQKDIKRRLQRMRTRKSREGK